MRKVVGIDIDKERVTEGMIKMRNEGIDIEMSVEDIFKTEFPEKSFDVVFTDAVLLMIRMDTQQIKEIIQKIVKTARKMILLVEWHNERVVLPGIDVGERFIRNYIELLNMFEVKDIQLRKIMEEWDSQKWQNWGYYITAKIC